MNPSQPVRGRWLAAWALLLTASAARGDTLRLRSGNTLEGKVESRTEEVVRFRTEPGVIEVKTADVLTFEQGPAPWERFEQIRGDYPDDADGQYALGLWCRSHGLPSMARKQFQKAVALDPTHEGALAALGGSATARVRKSGGTASGPAQAKARPASKPARSASPEDKLLRDLITQWHVRVTSIYTVKLKNRDESAPIFKEGRDQILAIHDPLAISAIASGLSRGPAAVRKLMIESLASFMEDGRDEATMNLIVTALLDPDPTVRRAAAQALVPRKDARVVGRLRKALWSKEDTVVRNAAVALGILKAREAVADMATVLFTVERRNVRYARQEIIGDVISTYGGRTLLPHQPGQLYYQPGVGVLAPNTVVGTVWVDEVRDMQVFRTDVQEALIAITGQNLGFDPEAWINWAREHQDTP